MSVLNQKEIINQLEKGVNKTGEGLLFHPLKQGSLRSCNLCLTASDYAYSLKNQEQLKFQSDINENGEENKYFSIPPHDTVLIWTDESIWLSKYFCASLHSPTSLVSKGIGHLGTRINPNWSGVLCIPLHNLSDEEVKINIQDTKNPIAYLMIYKLVGKSQEDGNIDGGARLDLIEGLPNAQTIYNFYQRRENRWMRDNIELLKKKVLESDEYPKIIDDFWKRFFEDISTDPKTIILIVSGIIT